MDKKPETAKSTALERMKQRNLQRKNERYINSLKKKKKPIPYQDLNELLNKAD